MIRAKKMMPRTSGTTSRQWRTIQATFSATAIPTRKAPSVTKIAIFLARLVKRILGLYLTILNETHTKKNRGAKAPRRKALATGYILRFGLISHGFLRQSFWYWWCEDNWRFRGGRGMDCFLAS